MTDPNSGGQYGIRPGTNRIITHTTLWTRVEMQDAPRDVPHGLGARRNDCPRRVSGPAGALVGTVRGLPDGERRQPIPISLERRDVIRQQLVHLHHVQVIGFEHGPHGLVAQDEPDRRTRSSPSPTSAKKRQPHPYLLSSGFCSWRPLMYSQRRLTIWGRDSASDVPSIV